MQRDRIPDDGDLTIGIAFSREKIRRRVRPVELEAIRADEWVHQPQIGEH